MRADWSAASAADSGVCASSERLYRGLSGDETRRGSRATTDGCSPRSADPTVVAFKNRCLGRHSPGAYCRRCPRGSAWTMTIRQAQLQSPSAWNRDRFAWSRHPSCAASSARDERRCACLGSTQRRTPSVNSPGRARTIRDFAHFLTTERSCGAKGGFSGRLELARRHVGVVDVDHDESGPGPVGTRVDEAAVAEKVAFVSVCAAAGRVGLE
jgi:hypothetical protein